MYFRIQGFPVSMHANSSWKNVADELNAVMGSLVEDSGVASTGFGPDVNIVEHKDKFEIVAELPGVKKEDLTLKMEKGELRLTAERKPWSVAENSRVVRKELRGSGTYVRSFRIPDEVESTEIGAQLSDGILRIELPKKKVAQPMEISVK